MKLETIHRDGIDYPALRCDHCRGLVHPPKALKIHALMHEVKALRHVRTKEENRRAFTSMRGNW